MYLGIALSLVSKWIDIYGAWDVPEGLQNTPDRDNCVRLTDEKFMWEKKGFWLLNN